MTAALGLVAPLLLATTKKTTSSASPTLFIFIAIAAAFYFLIYRPQQRKAKMAREVTKNYDVGDEVLRELPSLQSTAGAVATLDVLAAFAETARLFGY